jgi:NAD(P)-dependent dehydrogenase (short-subunit alcohol dehydrogenase family)
MMLRGKAALISGSTSGLGLAIADQLAGEGCNIVLNGLAEESEAAKLRDELARRHGVEVVFYGANLADPAQIADMMQQATMIFGHINVLVNNAVVRHLALSRNFRSSAGTRRLRSIFRRPSTPSAWPFPPCAGTAGGGSSMWRRSTASSPPRTASTTSPPRLRCWG